MSNDEFRASQAERRAAGLKARHETRLQRAVVRQVAELLAEKYTEPLDLQNRREDWTYPERPMSDRIKDDVMYTKRFGDPNDPGYAFCAPTCLEIAELLAEAGLLKEASA